MFGKHFKSMYEGSMVGAGAVVFATWGYVIANMVPDREVGAQVSLNARLIGPILGEPVELVERAIEYLCSPDKESRTKDEQGRRLIRLGQFDYQVVNGAKYTAIRDEEARREQNRRAARKYRDKIKAEEAKLGTKGLPYVNPDSVFPSEPENGYAEAGGEV